jgi:hypothetical protein
MDVILFLAKNPLLLYTNQSVVIYIFTFFLFAISAMVDSDELLSLFVGIWFIMTMIFIAGAIVWVFSVLLASLTLMP